MKDYAILETGAKQYWVESGMTFEIERQEIKENSSEIILDKVLLARKGENIKIGTPYLAGAKVLCDLLGEVRGPKVMTLKYRRRKASRRVRGHRQDYFRVRVKEITV
ncbi:MAG: 50S ribosomal protein L21 [Candidatus Omnitrophota bacterium]